MRDKGTCSALWVLLFVTSTLCTHFTRRALDQVLARAPARRCPTHKSAAAVATVANDAALVEAVWWPPAGAADSSAGGPGGTPGLTAEAVYNEVDRRIQQAKRSLTAMGELPEVHIDALSEKIANLLGQKVPTMKRERRNLVEGWHAHIKRQVSARGR